MKTQKRNVREIRNNIRISLILLLSYFMFPLLGNPGMQASDADISDDEITTAVETELRLNSTTPAYLIDVETNDGIVTLTGSVVNIRAKDRAASITRTVKGVRAVINNIEVNAPLRPDEVLENEVKEQLLKDPATDSYELYVEADNGIVTLAGKVQSFQEKELAEFVAKGVKGVRGLENNIIVNYEADRKDEEIEEEISRTLRFDNRIDDGAVFVNVKDGNVELSGVVGSAAERSLAKKLAQTIGVNSVNVEKLEVRKWARDEELRKSKYAVKTDNEILQAVKDALIYDPRVASFNPEVTVKEGVVTLSGTVDNLKAKQAAEQDAKNVVGVFHVNNNLKVRPRFIPNDDELESTISTSLRKDPIIDKWQIEAVADHGIVYLNGSVDSYFEKLHAEDIASRTQGVIDVENNLTVLDSDDAYFFNYYGWNTFLPPYQVEVNELFMDDEEIRKEIKNQLWWSPFVNEDEIEVKVDDGTAILSGVVDTRREKLHAEINAMEGGAEEVKNKIMITQK